MVSLDNIFGLFSHDDGNLSKDNKTTYEDLNPLQCIMLGCIKS